MLARRLTHEEKRLPPASSLAVCGRLAPFFFPTPGAALGAAVLLLPMAASSASPTPSDIIRELPAFVAHAREYALLGAYEVSLDYFDRAAACVARYMRYLVDSDERVRWSRAKEDLAAEAKLVKELVREVAVFKRPPGTGGGGGGARVASARDSLTAAASGHREASRN